MEYMIYILTVVIIYSLLAISLNLTFGYTGMLSLAIAAYFGIGAYLAAILSLNGLNFFLNILLTTLFCSLIAGITALPSLRLRGDYFVLASIGLQMLVFDVLYNWVNITKGPYGIFGIPRPQIFQSTLSLNYEYFLISLIILAISIMVYRLLIYSLFGLNIQAVKDDEPAAQALGKNTLSIKTKILAISGAFAGLAGLLYAHLTRAIDPSSFTISQSILILSIVLVGGLGRFWGPIIGSLIIIMLPEGLRFLGLPSSVSAPLQQIIYGLLLIIIAVFVLTADKSTKEVVLENEPNT